MRSILLLGARGTGKSTLLESFQKKLRPILSIDLLDSETERELLIKPEMLRQWIPKKAKA